MKRSLQMLALVLAAATFAWWLAAGGQRGWTKTSIPVKVVDEITGIEGVTYQQKFVPGVDFLGAGLLGAGALAAISLLIHNHTKTTTRIE